MYVICDTDILSHTKKLTSTIVSFYVLLEKVLLLQSDKGIQMVTLTLNSKDNQKYWIIQQLNTGLP